MHERAFAPSPAEADLVDALRAAGDLVAELCLVGLEGDAVVGHIAFSRARLDSGAGASASPGSDKTASTGIERTGRRSSSSGARISTCWTDGAS